MSSIRNFIIRAIEEDRWHLWIPATALAVVAYWQVAAIFLEPANARAAKPLPDAFAFTQMVFHPKPYDLPMYFAGYIVVPLLAFGIVAAVRRLRQAGHLTDRFLRLWPFALLASVILFVLFKMGLHLVSLDLWRQLPPRGNLIVQGLLAGSVLTALLVSRRFGLEKFMAWFERLPWLKLRWAMVAVIVLLVFSPNFPFDHDHYNDHLGPANDILHGKRFLQDTHSSYGFLNTYFLVGVFKFLPPISYQGLSLVLMIVSIGWYLGWYALLRRWLKSEAVAAAAVIAMVVFFNVPLKNFDFAYGPPSHTPFHQLAVLGVAYLWWRLSTASPGDVRRWERWLLFATAVGFFWFVDTGLYLVAATLIALLLRDFSADRSWQARLVTFARQAIALGLMIVGLGAVYSLQQFWQYGSWPDWSLLWRDAVLYQRGYMLLALPSHGLYEVYIFAFVLAGGYIFWRFWQREHVFDLLLPCFLVAFGILQLTYYINRPHSANLAPRMATFLIILLAWGYVRWQAARRELHSELSATFSGLVGGLVVLTVLYGSYKFAVTFRSRDYLHLRENYATEVVGRPDVYGGHTEVLSDIALLKRSVAPSQPIALIHWWDGKILLDLQTVNALPIYNLQSVFLKSQMDEAIAAARAKKPPVLFVGRVGSPGFDSFRYYADKIEYFRTRVEDLYVLEQQLTTMDVLRLKTE